MSRRPVAAAALAALVALPAFAQDATPFLEPSESTPSGDTALEEYLDERDRLVVERIRRLPPLPVGSGASLELASIIAFEPAHLENRMLGIRITAHGTALAGEDALTYLDLREVEELIRAIDLVDELLGAQPADADAEVRHVSRDGFGVVAKRTSGRRETAIRLHPPEDGEPVELSIGKDTLAALREQLERCRLQLFEE